MQNSNITIIGAGVVGLAIAYYFSEKYNNIYLIEKHESFGRETSSRNSEVIHASIYYPRNFIKGRLCLRGNELMYDLCKIHKIPCINSGKLIVATNEKEEMQLPFWFKLAVNNGAKGVRIINKDEIKSLEPNISANLAIHCPSSGIVDSHELMKFFEATAINNGVNVIYNHEVSGFKKVYDGFELTVKDKSGCDFNYFSNIVINTAGLGSGSIAEMVGIEIDKEGYRINYHKGIYFRVIRQLEKYPKMLVYPVPPESGGVGIHTTPDLYGGMRLGPHFIWDDKVEYSVDDSMHDFFYKSSKKFLPFLDYDDIVPDMAGIMSSVQKPGEGMKDFIIRHEYDKGLKGLINLIGIESPGLTAAPAIAELILDMVNMI